MARHKATSRISFLEQMLDEASWLLSHAQALADYGRPAEAAAERTRAAECEEHVACLLEADGQEHEAAIHRVSAASCHEKLGQYARALTLLRAALSVQLPEEYCTRVEQQYARCLAQARKELSRRSRRAARKQSVAGLVAGTKSGNEPATARRRR